MQKHTEMVMGTAVTFDIDSDDDAEAALGEAVAWLHWVDRTFTTYTESSFVSRYARGEVTLADCPPEMAFVVAECERYRGETEGWFDPWAGPSGFDPSGLVKGWAVQRASDLLVETGFDRHCLNAGGDVVLRGGPWGVGISHPLTRNAFCAVIDATDEAVATSGMAERGLHVWRPDGTPATELASVTIVGPDMSAADVYATAAFARGIDTVGWLTSLSSLQGIDSYVVDAGGHEWSTPGFASRRTWPPRDG